MRHDDGDTALPPAAAAGSLGFVRHYLLALQFFTRIPVTGRLARWVGYSPAMLRASAAHFPGVGWVVGAVASATWLLAAWALGPGPWMPLATAVLATAATVLLTGGFHEDGLADVADGLGGSAERSRALEIMKDSRIGAYGAMALVLALMLKVALLAVLAGHGVLAVGAALCCGHVLSRAAPLVVIWRLPHIDHGTDTSASPSKSKPLADRIAPGALAAACAWCVPAVVLLGWLLGPGCAAAALVAIAFTLAVLLRWFARRLQGFTGDCLGATQQVCEIATYFGLTAALARSALA